MRLDRSMIRAAVTALTLAMLGGQALPAGAQAPEGEAADRSLIAPMAARSLLLDAAVVDDLLVAVGERGHVLLSHDRGATWRQVETPTTATLTAVSFADRNTGIAVGHDAVIVRTRDGGESWERVNLAPELEKPLLEAWLVTPLHGYAVGAYGSFLETGDGGETWSERRISEEEAHLHHFARSRSGAVYLAAEAGMLFRSTDSGASWTELPSPYEGSLFGTLPLEGDSLLLFGLRGHLFRSEDGGESWAALATGTTEMLTDALDLGEGRVLVVGLGGTVLASGDGGRSFVLRQLPDRLGIQAIVPAGGDTVVLVGEQGARVRALGDLIGSAR